MATTRFGRHRSEGSSASTIGKAVLGVIIMAELVAIVLLIVNARQTDVPNSGGEADHVRIGTQSNSHTSYTNEVGDYTFRYPAEWKLEPDGSLAKVTSPDGNTVISLAPGLGADPLAASERLTARLRAAYADLEVTNQKVKSLGSHLGIVLEGTATNEKGVDLVFQAAAIQSGRSGFAVIGFTSDAVERLNGVFQDVLDSFEVEPA